MAFHDILFPDDISYGSKGGPGFNTTVLELSSGAEKRNINWQRSRAKYDVSPGIKSRAQMDVLTAFFTDTTTSTFQMIELYTSGAQTYTRNITKPITSGHLAWVGGLAQTVVYDVAPVGFEVSINTITGIVTLSASHTASNGLNVEVQGDFHVHCRFETDDLNLIHDFWETMSWDPIPIWEIKDTAA
jgi:hypothetical protein